MIGGAAFTIPIYLMSLTTSYLAFFSLFTFISGFGLGMIYMLPVRNAWLFYPHHKGMASGLILSCYSLGAIIWSFFTTAIANPNNELPDLVVFNGAQKELYYSPNSEVVKNVPKMLQYTAYIYFALILGAILCISKKEDNEI